MVRTSENQRKPDSVPDRHTVSIIIVTYNGLNYLATCLHSVFCDVLDTDEVIVIDNKSTDGSPQFMQETFPAVRVIENQDNHGFAAACNQGACLATGDVLVFLNQDTEVRPGWLSGLVEALDAERGVGLTTSRLLLMAAPDRIHLCGQDVHYTGLVFGRGYGQPAASQDVPGDVNAVSGASFAIRRELWERLGGFDESLYMYYEETDLSWRAQLAGYRCRYAPDSQALHDYRPDRPSESRLYYSFRNRTLLLLKNWRGITLLLLLPALLVAELLELGLALTQGWRGLRAKGKSYWWIATHLAQVRRMRASAQAQRRVSDVAILLSLVADIRPTTDDPGIAQHLIVAVANIIFRVNRGIALWLLRRLPSNAPGAENGARP